MSGRILTLPELIARETSLSPDDAQRLARAWSTEIRLELDQSGISVIRGLGTLTLTQGRVHFQQDPELPIGSDLPAVEGYSTASAAAAATAASGEAPPAPPSEQPGDGDSGHVQDRSDAAYGEEHLLMPDEDETAGETIGIGDLQSGTLEDLSRGDDEASAAVGEDGADEDTDHSWATADSHDDEAEDDVDWPEDDEDEDDEEYELDDDEQEDDEEDQAFQDGDDLFEDTPDDLIGIAHAAAVRNDDDAAEVTEDGSSAEDHSADDAEGTDEADPPHHAAPASSIRGRSRTPRRYEQQASGTSRTVIGAMAVILVIIIAAVMYRFVLVPESPSDPAMAALEDSNTSGSLPMESLDDDSLMAANIPAAEDTTTNASGTLDDTSVSDTETAAAQPDLDAIPSTDAAVDDDASPMQPIVAGMGGYTLIVGSTLNAETAESARRGFESLGLPTGVLPYESDDVTRYRIAVGNYPTAALADSARIQRAAELPEGTWVLSVR